MSEVQVYNPREVDAIWDGGTITGFSDNTMITIERTEDNYLQYDGVKGESTVAINATNNAIATLHLQDSSPWLSEFRSAARKDTDFLKSFSLIDSNDGANSVSSTQSYIIKEPDINRGKETQSIEVRIFMINVQYS